jgi:energy-coupling factor transporter ATP-binding protein EcfA2
VAVVILTFMSLHFATSPARRWTIWTSVAPDGTVVGIIGENGSGKSRLLRLAAGLETPTSGTIKASGDVRWLGPDDALNLAPAPVLLIDRTFGHQDLVVRERAAVALDRMRRAGPPRSWCRTKRNSSAAWPTKSGGCTRANWPAAATRRSAGVSQARRRPGARLGRNVTPPLAPTVRRGDGRAEILRVETVGENGKPTMVWRSGERAVVRVAVRFRERWPIRWWAS